MTSLSACVDTCIGEWVQRPTRDVGRIAIDRLIQSRRAVASKIAITRRITMNVLTLLHLLPYSLRVEADSTASLLQDRQLQSLDTPECHP